MNKTHFFLTVLLALTLNSFGQFTMDGEFRPRAEYRSGFGSIIADTSEPGFGISTRARLNLGYKNEAYNFFFSLQDVFVWGENRQLLQVDENNSLSIFNAWADITLSENWSTKIGRQCIAYDDQRILGSVGWAQQARSHDAALIKYANQGVKLDIGLAFNQDKAGAGGFSSVGNEYNTTGFFSYKTMQYLYAKKKWNSFSGSLLLLNNGFQEFDNTLNTDGVSNLQTLGTHLNYQNGSFGATSNLFYQTGKRQGELKVKDAYLASLDLNYKASENIGLNLGAEVISGNKEEPGTTSAFFPLYGTNHKFNGFMDYFYVGNHANSIGLFDIHIATNIKFKDQSKLLVKLLHFSGEQELTSGYKNLGSELDLMYTKAIKPGLLQIGYSHMFPSTGGYELKGIDKSLAADVQNWAWIQLTINPKFIKQLSI